MSGSVYADIVLPFVEHAIFEYTIKSEISIFNDAEFSIFWTFGFLSIVVAYSAF